MGAVAFDSSRFFSYTIHMFEPQDSITNKILKAIKLFFWKLRNQKLKVIASSFLGLIGFLLSPLSWWNDVFVNLPLAWLFAYIITLPFSYIGDVSRIFFGIIFSIGYLLTNVLGFYLMHMSIVNLTEKETISHKKQFTISILYTLIFLALIYFNVINLVAPGLSFLPGFVK